MSFKKFKLLNKYDFVIIFILIIPIFFSVFSNNIIFRILGIYWSLQGYFIAYCLAKLNLYHKKLLDYRIINPNLKENEKKI